ncbi:Invertase 4 [Colletotrichum orbiculare MAFF 240422]|uniref:Invertase 4 n=1 Tax=Colletotrichum orbiculare (strain 104-T / ATCC 96160 / CBS 514.97 / LARS 414 / MAFF 240422) TaxID=1213857 RepID=N4V395_COLOR|nr:Invertase 4 [Colletotrichum orbiculare MAFF 240422]
MVIRNALLTATFGAIQLTGLALGQSTTSSEPIQVPTGTPIVGDYNGAYRPQVHFSPPQHFMNDPNGMFRDADGVWHLYYQYNPTDVVAGNQHWGHATSKDLYHWTNQPIALFPPEKDVFIYSGSAVVDVNNTSGFFPDQDNGVVAIYTLASPTLQTQGIAYSRDGGYTFTPYENNPVINSTTAQFRDPKVVRYNDLWVMVVAYPHDFAVGIFTSPDLKDWTATSNFSHHGILGLQYECPNLIPIPYVDEEGQRRDDMWLMAISINPGAPLGGSIAQYHPGTFNGTHFEAVDAAARIADFGKDNYASQWFYGLPDDEYPVSIAWASNWQYTQAVPTGAEGWRSVMSLPRRNYLTKAKRVGWKLVSEPYNLEPVLGRQLASNDSMGNGTLTVDYSDVESNAVYWEVNVTGIPDKGISATASLNFTFSNPAGGEYINGGYFLGGDAAFFVNRNGARGFDNVFFTERTSIGSLTTGANSWSLSGVIDRSILEVFINGGVDSATNTFFTTRPLSRFVFGAMDLPGGTTLSVKVRALESAWKQMESQSDGLVHGNQSASGI